MIDEQATTVSKSKKTYRPVQSGLSVLARGESFVWLTGGMLIVSIGMIACLLCFIFIRGMGTFWPQPFAVYPVQSGGLIAGEVQSIDTFAYEANQLNSLSEKAQANAIARLANEQSALAKRVYLRVGNFELSGQHFDYLNEFERTSEETFYPENAWVVERLSNGRLYGWPMQLTESFNPSFDPRFAQLTTAKDLVQQLSEFATEQNTLDAEQVEAIVTKLSALQNAIAVGYFQRVLEATPLQEGERWEAQVADQSWQSFTGSAIPPDATALRLVATTFPSIQKAFENAKGSIAGLIRRSSELQEELASNDEHLKDARLDLRQIEIDHGAPFLDRVVEIESDWTTISIAKQQLEEQEIALKSLIAASSLSEEEKSKLTALFGVMKSDFQSQIEQMQTASDETINALADLPKECITGIKTYRDVVESSAAKQTKLNQQIADTETEMNSAMILFQTTRVESVEELDPAQAKSLTQSQNAQQIAPTAWMVTENANDGMKVRFVSSVDTQWREAKLQSTETRVAEIVRAYLPNQLSLSGKLGVMGSRWVEFLTDRPREAGMEGGFFPAIWGTIVMTMIMALFVVPFGVLAALYLREYATSGFIVGILRIAINNLAGVPSVVYGVFGLAFFCYIVGGYIDGGPDRAGITPWPPLIWYVALAAVAITSVTAFFLEYLLLRFTNGTSPVATNGAVHFRLGMDRIGSRFRLASFQVTVL